MSTSRRSFLSAFTCGLAAIAAGALKYTPAPVRKSKFFGNLDQSVGCWSSKVLRRYPHNGSTLSGLFEKLKEGDGATATYNWFERDPSFRHLAHDAQGDPAIRRGVNLSDMKHAGGES